MSNANTTDYSDLMAVLTVKPHPGMRATYSVAYNGRILGDDRSYSTVAECEAAITARIAKDAQDAIRYDRPVLLTR